MVRFSPQYDLDEVIRAATRRRTECAPGPRPVDRSPTTHQVRCCDLDARPLLVLYALSECAAEEALTFEAHLLECEACFTDLKCLDRSRALIQEFLGPRSDVRDRVRGALRGGGHRR